jgi:hypothetical protein
MRTSVVGLAFSAVAFALLMMAPTGTSRADQPHMQSALDALRTAETQLNQADPDKGGHRASALKHVREAIRETEAGIRFDRKH